MIIKEMPYCEYCKRDYESLPMIIAKHMLITCTECNEKYCYRQHHKCKKDNYRCEICDIDFIEDCDYNEHNKEKLHDHLNLMFKEIKKNKEIEDKLWHIESLIFKKNQEFADRLLEIEKNMARRKNIFCPRCETNQAFVTEYECKARCRKNCGGGRCINKFVCCEDCFEKNDGNCYEIDHNCENSWCK
jgi:hypothetical protein